MLVYLRAKWDEETTLRDMHVSACIARSYHLEIPFHLIWELETDGTIKHLQERMITHACRDYQNCDGDIDHIDFVAYPIIPVLNDKEEKEEAESAAQTSREDEKK